MKTTTMKNFAGLTYVTVLNIPIKGSAFGDIIDVQPRELERLVAIALIENKIPIRGAEFRVLKSAIGMSNEEIGEKLGVSRNTVLKWGKEIEKRLPPPYEMLVRLLVVDVLGISISATIEDLRAGDKTKRIHVKAA
jgi:DNA-binding CsgD family transcriptional regulator